MTRIQENGVTIAVEDFFGEISYSRFCVVFSRQFTKKKSLEKAIKLKDNGRFDQNYLTDLTCEIMQKLVLAYKFISELTKDWIPNITKFRLAPYQIRILDSNNDQFDGCFFLDYRGTGTSLGNIISEKQLNEIKRICNHSSVDLEVSREFLGEANRFKQTGDYKAAIVYLSFYFEKFIFREVKYKLSKDGFTDIEIEQKVKKKNGNYIHRYDAIALITQNKDFMESSEFKAYDNYIIKPRNMIVHDDSYKIDSDFAEKMMKAANDFIQYVVELIWGADDN